MPENLASICTSLIVWGLILASLWLMRPSSSCIRTPVSEIGRVGRVVICLVAIAEIAFCAFAMTLSPAYVDGKLKYTNQYERIADSFLEGRLDFGYDVDPRLEELDNPYDPAERTAAHVKYHWDHAYYNGRYYMYFGVVPAILLFVPFKAITGTTLATYHATQLLTALIIAGFFFLFYRISRKQFPRMPVGAYTALSVALSGVSIWYIVAAPALYCTAIAAGICFMIWSITLFLLAFDNDNPFRKTIALTIGGALCGALAFGCRPTIAIANLTIVAMLFNYLRTNHLGKRQLAALFAAGLIPYLAVAAGLFAYNYVRFDSIFEFGQAYQLTVADQHDYGFSLDRIDLDSGMQALSDAFFAQYPTSAYFPYVKLGGIFFMTPLLLAGLLLYLPSCVRKGLRQFPALAALGKSLPFVAVLIVVLDLFMSPYWTFRYTMDVNWMFAIAGFISCGMLVDCVKDKHRAWLSTIVGVLAIATTLSCVLLFLEPYDYNATDVRPELIEEIKHAISFGLK